mmetsp:Transcript_9109/g.12208  ORF Transcript_9109/g.12208 Transcript_9109/m.12208 type:complete len:571 (+) Transcript_9109:35-1747(+)|eukprot:CAMPEP_0201488238 /NCGR_PEP_ID=MMETSP0151_2-20130828/17842_1 /ASSEMBLY_ACC=CAM_ASM_000257 /TAXON_ID=200890 /ORGANISM="Paramoeba atlantica, Strain 621/1 / CCAP 1560/9" /LENGTH=570 /DNA_ID=CAMNT_0047873493 /DNA_START=35 /DNA_END=1747 /DNA_ORIENTATION=+
MADTPAGFHEKRMYLKTSPQEHRGLPPSQQQQQQPPSAEEFLALKAELEKTKEELEKTRKELHNLKKSTKPSRKINLLHFNDVYNLEPKSLTHSPCGGATRFSAAVKEARAKYSDTITLFSGDFVGPSLASTFTRGRHIVEALDTIGVDYGCLGNHEWDYGIENLARHLDGTMTEDGHAIAGSRVSWIMSNMNGEDGNPVMGCSKFEIIERGGNKIGLIGLAEDWTFYLPISKGLVNYIDMFVEGERLANWLKKEHQCDVVIALTHNRLHNDYEVTKRCPSIDLLLGGHDHFFKQDLDCRIIKSGEEWKYLSIVTLELVEGEAPSITVEIDSIEADEPEDPEMVRLVNKYIKFIESKFGVELCQTAIDLDSREVITRFLPSMLGMHMSDFVVDSLNRVFDEDDPIDMAFVTGYEIKGEMCVPAGDFVKLKDLMAWVPKEVMFVALQLTGKQIKEWFEISFAGLSADGSAECGTFIHPSHGVEVSIDPRQPSGQRIVEFNFEGKPVQDEKLYVCGGTKWVAKHFSQAKRVIEKEWAVSQSDVLRRGFETLAREKKKVEVPVDFEKRVKIIH